MSAHHAVLFRVDNPDKFVAADFTMSENVVEYRTASLGIDEVRKLIADANRRPDGIATTKTLLVVANFITEESQHALLKIVEEPPLSTRFIFVVPTGVSLLPTLLSRFQAESISTEKVENVQFTEFLEASLNRRLRLIEDALKDKNTDWQMAIKLGLVEYLGSRNSKLSSEQLIGLEYVTRTLLTRGASNKFLLEYAAIVLPA